MHAWGELPEKEEEKDRVRQRVVVPGREHGSPHVPAGAAVRWAQARGRTDTVGGRVGGGGGLGLGVCCDGGEGRLHPSPTLHSTLVPPQVPPRPALRVALPLGQLPSVAVRSRDRNEVGGAGEGLGMVEPTSQGCYDSDAGAEGIAAKV